MLGRSSPLIDFGTSDVAVMNADGTGSELVASDGSKEQYDPAFLPDGTKIAYVEFPSLSLSARVSPQSSSESLVVANRDGSGAQVVSPPGVRVFGPDWRVNVAATPTLTPSPTTSPSGDARIWGDNNCSGGVNPVDSLLVLRDDAGLPTDTGECPDMGQVVEVANASPHPWGDVDCSAAMTPVDSLKILRDDAGLDVSRAAGCPDIGADVTVTE